VEHILVLGEDNADQAVPTFRLSKGDDDFEEEEEHLVSPVHSLAVQQDSLWALGGTESGNINLYTLRHEPGQLRHVLRRHTSAVSALALTNDDTELISGGWDRGVHVSVNGVEGIYVKS
jgi:WD40 repeat protein